MNQTRTFLLIAWLAVAALLWIEWNKPAAAPAVAPGTEAVAPAPGAPATTPAIGALPAPGALPPAGTPAPAGNAPLAASPAATAAATGPRVTLSNDRLRLTVDLAGGRIVDARLLQYTVEKKAGSPNVQLFSDAPGRYYVADAGLISVDGRNPQRDLQPVFAVQGGVRDAVLAPGADATVLPLTWTDAATGLTVTRTLRLRRGSYLLEVDDVVANRGAAAQRLYPYAALSRTPPPPPPKYAFLTSPETFSFTGAAWWTPEDKYVKAALADFDDEVPSPGTVQGGWIGMLQHHFASAWVPRAQDVQTRFETATGTHAGVPLYTIRTIAAPMDVAPGRQATHQQRLWVGPKLQEPMSAIAPELWRTVDYGVLSFIAQPLFWLLATLHGLLGNWGWAIIAIVLLIKGALYWVSKKQYISMAKVRALQPRMEALKERYGEDRQAYQMAMMELYKKEKVNPMGGCLPILIQMPVFLGLYWVLLETVELRHAPWIGWIQNLTAADPYFVLPALNLLVMYLTQKLTPTPGMDPMQKKMMQAMPLIFGVMMAFFPAGLVLYWVTNGALGLLQQWWLTRKYGGGAKPATPAVAR